MNKENTTLLFLDDYRMPIDCAKYMYRKGVDCTIYHKQWFIVRSYYAFVRYITENGLPQFISFDHDLADEFRDTIHENHCFNQENKKEYTGMDCAKWLVNYCINNNKPLPEYAVHSANPVGAENIDGLLKSYNNMLNNKIKET